MFKIIFTTLITLTLSFSVIGCGSAQATPNPNQKPTWVYNPYQDSIIAGVGSANKTFKGGYAKQKSLAVERALTELAHQYESKVDSSISSHQQDHNGKVNSNVEMFSTVTASGVTVKAHIAEMWSDPRSGELFVWMRAD